LAAKDTNGKSDPYCKFGFVTEKGKFLDNLVHKTKYLANTLNPTWTDKEHAEGKFIVKPNEAVIFRIEVWDKDSIGKDDFMGQHDIPFLHFLTTPNTSGYKCNLTAKAKERISGYIIVGWQFESST